MSATATTPKSDTTWPARVRALRLAMGLKSQAGLARVLRVGRASVERWEQGVTVPRDAEVIALIVALEARHKITQTAGK